MVSSFLVACRSLVGGMFVALALPLYAVERCDDARHVGAVILRISSSPPTVEAWLLGP